MPKKSLQYDPDWQPGPPRGPISGPWERVVQFGLRFWILDLLMLLPFCYLTAGFSLASLLGLPRIGLLFTTHSLGVWLLALFGAILILLWWIYRQDRRGWWDDPPGWTYWLSQWLP